MKRIFVNLLSIGFVLGIFFFSYVRAETKEGRKKDLEFEEQSVEGLGRDQRRFRSKDISAGTAKSQLFDRKQNFDKETKKTFREMRYMQ